MGLSQAEKGEPQAQQSIFRGMLPLFSLLANGTNLVLSKTIRPGIPNPCAEALLEPGHGPFGTRPRQRWVSVQLYSCAAPLARTAGSGVRSPICLSGGHWRLQLHSHKWSCEHAQAHLPLTYNHPFSLTPTPMPGRQPGKVGERCIRQRHKGMICQCLLVPKSS